MDAATDSPRPSCHALGTQPTAATATHCLMLCNRRIMSCLTTQERGSESKGNQGDGRSLLKDLQCESSDFQFGWYSSNSLVEHDTDVPHDRHTHIQAANDNGEQIFLVSQASVHSRSEWEQKRIKKGWDARKGCRVAVEDMEENNRISFSESIIKTTRDFHSE